MIPLIQHFEADFLWKVSLKILNSEMILKTFTHALWQTVKTQINAKKCGNLSGLHCLLDKNYLKKSFF